MSDELAALAAMLLEKHHGGLTRFAAYRMPPGHVIRSHHEVHLNVDDCVQIAYEKTWKWIEKHQKVPSNFAAFVRKVIRRVLATAKAKSGRRKTLFDYYIGTEAVLACELDGMTDEEKIYD